MLDMEFETNSLKLISRLNPLDYIEFNSDLQKITFSDNGFIGCTAN